MDNQSEHSKGAKEHAKKNTIDQDHEDAKPFLDPKTRDLSSPSSRSSSSSSSSCSSILEFDIDEKGSFKDPSTTIPSGPPPEEQSQMESPPLQTMVHPPGYDPNRIPASVFASSPGDWSLTSNESLFSIHMGNNSFSRDHAILFGKSGEFPRLDDWTSELSSLPPVMEVSEHEESSVRSRKDSGIRDKDSAHGKVDMESHAKPQLSPVVVTDTPHVRNASSPRVSGSNSRVSDVSGHSGSSFAFPVLSGEGGKSNGSFKIAAKETDKMQKPHELQANVSSKEPTPNKPNASEGKCCRWFCWSWCPRCC